MKSEPIRQLYLTFSLVHKYSMLSLFLYFKVSLFYEIKYRFSAK